tara:strand:+ start:61 stop:837 length:777 start_codon:yes stop_codon:yes gene_type:complete
MKAESKYPNTIESLSLEDLIPYARNSRTHSEEQVSQIAGSIREFGFTNPVLVGDDNGIIAGHGRVLAAKKLGIDKVPCIRLGYLTEAQKRAYVIADNKIALNAGWDEELLAIELTDLREIDFNLDLTGFDADQIEHALNPDKNSELSDEYTHKIDAPVYEPKGENPDISDLVNLDKMKSLVEKLKKAKLPPDITMFLIRAANRHMIFNYEKIAEFYCHADKKTQALMEDSALVVIDFKKAMQLGYLRLKEEVEQMLTD